MKKRYRWEQQQEHLLHTALLDSAGLTSRAVKRLTEINAEDLFNVLMTRSRGLPITVAAIVGFYQNQISGLGAFLKLG